MIRRSPLRLLAGAGTLAVLAVLAGTAAAGPAPIAMPKYRNYVAPGAMATNAGEPSIGVNWKTGAVFLQAGFDTAKVLFDAKGEATWSDVSTPFQVVSLDPLLHADNANGRVFVSQLTGLNSSTSYTDDDGKTYTPSTGGGIPSGVDHQSLGSGPYPKGGLAGPLTAFPHAVYYCSQELITAFCARSDDGGRTFGAGVPIYTGLDCEGIHGHVRVSPDGTVYVPNKDCGGKQGFVVSTDAGLTWTLRTVPGSIANDFIIDPSLSAGEDNTAYLGFVNGDGRALITVTRDRGVTFSEPVDVGAKLGVVNATFPEVVAGDGDRAAFAFLGTRTPGDAQDVDFGKDPEDKTVYSGASYALYIATTFDRGAHWTTVNATGSDPVQRGRVCNAGTFCDADRNLLDFMDIDMDKSGRVVVGWADGCTNDCVTSNEVADNGLTAKGVVTRQSGGTSLIARTVAAPVAARPAAAPPAQPAPTRPGRELAATGLTAGLPLTALALLVVALVVRRRRTA